MYVVVDRPVAILPNMGFAYCAVLGGMYLCTALLHVTSLCLKGELVYPRDYQSTIQVPTL